jgi:hypothetical protein
MGTPASQAKPTSTPHSDDERRVNHSLYDEYVRGFDEVPVLDDAVIVPPRRALPPNFVRGERRNLRSEQRADGYSIREANLAELELLYREYVAPTPLAPKPKKRAAKKRGGRKSSRAKSRA